MNANFQFVLIVGLKKHECKICDKIFSQVTNLKDHIESFHEGESKLFMWTKFYGMRKYNWTIDFIRKFASFNFGQMAFMWEVQHKVLATRSEKGFHKSLTKPCPFVFNQTLLGFVVLTMPWRSPSISCFMFEWVHVFFLQE